MKLKELVVLTVIEDFLNKRRTTQLGISKDLGISLSTVSNALQPLAEIGAIDIKPRGLKVVDLKKSLAFLASIRSLQKDIIYETFVPNGVGFIEKNMPSSIAFTCFSAYKFKFNETPADYSEVYAYSDFETLEEVKKRFPKMKGPPNLIVLDCNEKLSKLAEGGLVPISLLFADLWNAREWYAKEFLGALEGKLGLK